MTKIVTNENLRQTKWPHHAYCFVGPRIEAICAVHQILESDFAFRTTGNPDYWRGEYDVLLLDDSKEIKRNIDNRPVANEIKVLVIATNFIHLNSQNSFLKLLEEPNGHSVLFLLMPSDSQLLPTIKSRLIFVNQTDWPKAETTKIEENSKVEKKESLFEVETFLAANSAERLKRIEKILAQYKDDKVSKGDLVNFILNLGKGLRQKIDLKERRAETTLALEVIAKSLTYAEGASPSFKTILEYLAIIVPKV